MNLNLTTEQAMKLIQWEERGFSLCRVSFNQSFNLPLVKGKILRKEFNVRISRIVIKYVGAFQ